MTPTRNSTRLALQPLIATSGALMMVLLAGCGLTTIPPAAPAVPAPPHGLRPAPPAATERINRVAPDLHFALNSHVLDAKERHKLARIAPDLESLLHDFPDVVIVIEGHSDDRGVIEYNDRLALERADAVRGFLLNLSFPEDRLRSVSLGYRAPQCVAQDDVCRQKNRRVHFRAALPIASIGATR